MLTWLNETKAYESAVVCEFTNKITSNSKVVCFCTNLKWGQKHLIGEDGRSEVSNQWMEAIDLSQQMSG